MTGYQRCKITKCAILLLFLGIFFSACKKEDPPKKIVAKVGSSILTEERLDSLLSFSGNKSKYREEIIRDWIESELLYKQAQKEKITKSKMYDQLVKSSNKKLAGSLYLNRFMQEQDFEVSDLVLADYFHANEEDFKLSSEAYVFNRVVFNDESKAILFRSTLNESDWNKTLNVFSGDESIISSSSNNFRYIYQINTREVGIVLNNLEVGEVSIIFETGPEKFNVMQLVANYDKGTIPNLSYIKKKVLDHYISSQKAKRYEDLLQGLYSKYDVIIN